jgi:hypothetical protein
MFICLANHRRFQFQSAKKQARAQRFGIPASPAGTNPATPIISAIATDEALQKRAQRFGLPVGTPAANGNDVCSFIHQFFLYFTH